MKRFQNNLDERQEQELLKIEHNGVWGVFIGLLAAILVQSAMGMPFSQIAGEWIVFMALCIYMVVACARRGIWDRYLEPKASHNLLASAVGGAVIFVLLIVVMWRNMGAFEPVMLIISLVIAGFFTLVCFAVSSFTSAYVKKRAYKLEASEEDEE